MNENRYSMAADSRHWWRPFAGAATAAVAASVAITVTSAGAVPVDGTATAAACSIDISGRCGPTTIPVNASTTNAIASSRPCFFDSGPGSEVPCRPGPTRRIAERTPRCPEPPDFRYVGVPWVPAVPTGCASIDRWWTRARPVTSGP
jgi:hypothetical protein